MEQIIKRAIEGGWNPSNILGYVYKKGKKFNDESVFSFPSIQGRAILHPLFWQALGKACGWHFCRVHTQGEFHYMCEEGIHDDWYKNALRFHEINLTEGWDKAVEFLSNLVKE